MSYSSSTVQGEPSRGSGFAAQFGVNPQGGWSDAESRAQTQSTYIPEEEAPRVRVVEVSPSRHSDIRLATVRSTQSWSAKPSTPTATAEHRTENAGHRSRLSSATTLVPPRTSTDLSRLTVGGSISPWDSVSQQGQGPDPYKEHTEAEDWSWVQSSSAGGAPQRSNTAKTRSTKTHVSVGKDKHGNYTLYASTKKLPGKHTVSKRYTLFL